MMERPRGTVLAVLDRSVDAGLVQSSLPHGTSLRFAPFDAGVEEVAAAMRDTPADLMLVGFGDEGARALELIERARSERPDGALVVLQTGAVNGLMERMFELGADDIVTLPQPAESLSFVFQKAIARRRATPATGAMICILGPKGGTGKTLTACNLAIALAERGKRCVIVDIDLEFGDIGIALGLSPERTIYHLAVSGGSQDADKLDQFLVDHRSGVRALLAPTRPDQAGAIDAALLRDVFTGLRGSHDVVVVDTPPSFSPEVIATIDSASDLCVVGMLDVLSLKDTKIGLETLSLMGHDPRDVKLVLNRADTDVGISAVDVVRILGRAPDVSIPSDRAIPLAITRGEAIIRAEPESAAAAAFRELAQLFVPEPSLNGDLAGSPAGATPPLRRLWRRGG